MDPEVTTSGTWGAPYVTSHEGLDAAMPSLPCQILGVGCTPLELWSCMLCLGRGFANVRLPAAREGIALTVIGGYGFAMSSIAACNGPTGWRGLESDHRQVMVVSLSNRLRRLRQTVLSQRSQAAGEAG